MPRLCEVRRLGSVTYQNGLDMQERLVRLRQNDEIPDQLLLLQHTPVITAGRLTAPEHLLASPGKLDELGIAYFETNRGGDITYHGPGQIVGYPILHLGEGNRDVRKYVTNIEEVLIRTVAEFGIEAGRREGARGVWVGHDKIAAIGVRVSRWVTSHGFALNVSTELSHFETITPCGIPDTGVTSIERLFGRPVPLDEVEEVILHHFSEIFERELFPKEHGLEVVKVVLHDGDRFLLLKRNVMAGGFWQPVTGRVEAGESPETAGSREVMEETGIVSDLGSRVIEQSFLVAPEFVEGTAAVFAHETCFDMRVPGESPVSLDVEEHEEFGWFTLDEALQHLRWSDDAEAIRLVHRGFGGN